MSYPPQKQEKTQKPPLRIFKTPKGTDLPLRDLRGNEYLDVKFRLVWVREEHPDWRIETELVSYTSVMALAKATIRNERGEIVAQGHKLETPEGFADYIEKAETGAVGRALAMCGYGTQFCSDELDEGERIVDGPVNPKNVASQAANNGWSKSPPPPFDPNDNFPEDSSPDDPGEYVVEYGKKFHGQKMKDIKPSEIRGYIKWLTDGAKAKGQPLRGTAEKFVTFGEAYLKEVQSK